MILIKNANIVTMGEKDFPGGDVLIGGGKIRQVGYSLHAPDARVIDGTGLTALPGFIDAHCHVGISEEGMRDEGEDTNEMSNPVTPQMRALDAINPFDIGFKEAAENGVTCVMTGPGSANVLGGQFVTMKTHGRDLDDMVIDSCSAMKAAFGENPKGVYREKKMAPMTRMATAAILRQSLTDALGYMRKRGKDDLKLDLGTEVLCAVLEKRIPLKIHAHRADDILTAIRIAREFDLRFTLDHCTEGHLVLEQIKQSGAWPILGPWVTGRSKIELNQMSMNAPAMYARMGIPFAFMTDHPVTPLMYLPFEAAIAVRRGLDERIALQAMTINPAKILGLESRLGSIEQGKDADIALYEGDPMDMRTKCKLVMINGEIIKE